MDDRDRMARRNVLADRIDSTVGPGLSDGPGSFYGGHRSYTVGYSYGHPLSLRPPLVQTNSTRRGETDADAVGTSYF